MRPKPFLTYFILCAIPLLLLAGLNYWNGVSTVNATLNTAAQNNLESFNFAVTRVVERRKENLLFLAVGGTIQDVLRRKENKEIDPASNPEQMLDTQLRLKTTEYYGRPFEEIVIYGTDRRPLCFRLGSGSEWSFKDAGSMQLPQPHPSVWAAPGTELFQQPSSIPRRFEYTVPVHDEHTGRLLGAIVCVFDLEALFRDASPGYSWLSSMRMVLDRTGYIVFFSYGARKGGEPYPGTDAIVQAMANQASGMGQFRLGHSNYQLAYAVLPDFQVGMVAAEECSDWIANAHRWGIAGLVLALLSALVAAFVLEHHVSKRSSGIARVREDLSAIAKGELDRRIILQSSDDARGIADNINVVTEQLRAKIAREEESRQFESFVRLSAMLTHDLKNAIEGLSLTVSNMERHFDNPQFRTDAMKGLTSATDKLKALVARLARPVTSLSGEHKRPANVDLVPILKRVIATHAEPARNKYRIVTRFPSSLYALVDEARIEEVMENLVLNAIEAMDDGGTLTVEAGPAPNGEPSFSVGDTGRGMSKSFIETRLFRPFSTTKKTGIGLGLYTCREVIHASAGSIKVKSAEGAGTTFHVVLPSIPHDRRN